MNVSKFERRTLHALAYSGRIHIEKESKGKIIEVT
ncbi:YjhX family toxin [Parvibaculum sp.]|nr:YjhX family toxin [Parvibaculum sp.]HCX68270.1 hypothetical protein [Rhodobiaceae bacterium]